MSKPNKFRQVNRENMEAQPNEVENKTTSTEPAKIASIVAESGDKSKGPSYLNKIATCIKSAASTTWNWCQTAAQWTWSGIKTIPSYCVIRWDTGNDTDEIDEIVPTKNVANIESVKAEPIKAAIKPVESKTNETVVPPVAGDKSGFSFASFVPHFSVKALCTSWLKFLPQRAQRAHEDAQYDEDELAPSRWWGIGIKAAAATAAVLILVGGYFVVKPFFNAPIDVAVADMEILDPTEQPKQPAQELEPVPPVVETPSVLATPTVAAVPAPALEPIASQVIAVPPVTAPIEVPAPPQPQPEAFALTITTTPSPAQGSLFGNEPFLAPPAELVAPAVADTAPPVAVDSVVGTVKTPTLAELQPLVPLTPVQVAEPQPPLQPLVALNVSSFSSSGVSDAPAATTATVYAPVAANYNERTQETNPLFNQIPTPPSVSTFPQTAVERTFVASEPTKEIVPQIQHTGTIQDVPPPVVVEVVPESQTPESRQNTMNSEATPAIPRDAPTVASPPIIVVPATAPVTELSPPQVLATTTQPIDRQLWEQVELLRNGTEAKPTQLQFGTPTTTSEPALRFTPRNALPPANENTPLTQEVADSLQDLLPDPETNAATATLSALPNAPQPVWAELAPAYRDDATNQSSQSGSEGGLTFQSRVDSQISRSPLASETYTIQPGDTYMTISDKFYGTSLLYTALAQHNQQLGLGWRPAEGVVIEIPTAEFLRTYYGEATSLQERRLNTQRAAVRYIVQEGDTVFRLATDRLQDSTRWREIYAMNADRLQDVWDLRPGMEILLPVVGAVQRN